MPKLYNGLESFSSYKVCCEGNTTYDPIAGKPVPLEDFGDLIFGEDISFRVLASQDRFREMIHEILSGKIDD